MNTSPYTTQVDRLKYWDGPGLYSIGIPKDSVVKYESALKSGRFLVLVYGTGDQVSNARDIVQAACPMEVAVHKAEQTQQALNSSG